MMARQNSEESKKEQRPHRWVVDSSNAKISFVSTSKEKDSSSRIMIDDDIKNGIIHALRSSAYPK